MQAPKKRPIERRKYDRLSAPVAISYISDKSNVRQVTNTRNISAEGLGFETMDGSVSENDLLEMAISMPGAPNPVHTGAKVIWKRKLSLEDSAPYDVGVEFINIEEDNKNTFLKFLCDLLYKLSKEQQYEHAND